MNTFVAALRNWLSTHPDLSIVLGAGAIGGLLATAVQGLVKHDGSLVSFVIPSITFGKALMYALLGAIAAAFSIYIAANSRLDDLKRLTFFALLCGITFPAILANSVDQAAERAQEQLELGKKVAADSPEAAEAVAKDALNQAPALQVDPAKRVAIGADTTALIKELQSQRTDIASEAATNIFQSARAAGYNVPPPAAPPPDQAQAAPPVAAPPDQAPAEPPAAAPQQ